MQFPPNERIQLHFYLHKDAPLEYRNHWTELMFKLNGKSSRIEQLEFWKSFMKLDSNKLLPILNRPETGLGGDNNVTDKQIHFNNNDPLTISHFYPYVIDILASNNTLETWSLAEVTDLKYAFKEFLKQKWDLRAVDAMIVIL